MAGHGEVTRLLEQVQDGDERAQDQLIPLIYDELHGLARQHMARERKDHTLQTTALIHEAFLRLAASPSGHYANRGHFLRVASRAMRHILVDHARARQAQKAGGDMARVEFEEALLEYEERGIDLLTVHEALDRLGKVDTDLVHVVEMHFFGGLTFAEIGAALGVTERTVFNRWYLARAWLRGALVEGFWSD